MTNEQPSGPRPVSTPDIGPNGSSNHGPDEPALPTNPQSRLQVEHASPERTVESLRDILSAAGGLYDRGTPVRLYYDGMQKATLAQHLRAEDLVLHAHRVCRPFVVKTGKDSVEREEDARLPRPIAEMYLGWQGEWRLPVLNGIARSPLLRDDGSFRAVAGYDAASGIWCEQVPDLTGRVPGRPSRDDAAAALRRLRRTFGTFPFADAVTRRASDPVGDVVDVGTPPGADETAFLAALITAIARASLHLAPGVLFRAAPLSGAGAGKGLLVRCICLVAFGAEPHAVSWGAGREELEKRIASELIEARPVMFLDNLNSRTFKSDLLASVITERPARVRVLGRSQMVPLNPSAFIAIAGNGITLAEDLARRFLIVEFDPRTENPEARPFAIDIKQYCRQNREALLADCLTIWRWGRQAGMPSQGLPFGSFEQWATWVRDPLVALGCKDPVARVGETKARDTERQDIREIFEIWWRHHKVQPVAIKDLAHEVCAALNPLGRARQYLAKRLESLAGARVGGFVLLRQAPMGTTGTAVYALNRTAAGHGPKADQTPPSGRSSVVHAPCAPDANPACREMGTRADPNRRVQTFCESETHGGHRGHKASDRGWPGTHAPYTPDASRGRERIAEASGHEDTAEMSRGYESHGGHTFSDDKPYPADAEFADPPQGERDGEVDLDWSASAACATPNRRTRT